MGLWVWGAPYERATNATVHSLSDLALWRAGADAFAAAALNELDWRWQRAAYASPLRVLVLGGSVTGGCGATSACHAGAVSTACSIETSWGLILSDSLQQSLRGVEVQVGLFGKSAVDASYFEQCPSRFGLRADTNIVLLELENSAVLKGPRGLSDIAELVAGVRRAAPKSAVAFIGWPPSAPHDGWNTIPPEWVSTFERGLLSAPRAPSVNLDVLLLRSVMRPLLERNYSTGEGEGDGGFHADKAHPNCAGHALMGRAVASFLIERLRRERARALVNESGADLEHDAVEVDVPAPWGSVRTVLPSDATDDMLLLHHEEVCYTSAADMPVSFPVSSGQLGASDGHHGTWRLVNDGGVDNPGVEKLGYESYLEVVHGTEMGDRAAAKYGSHESQLHTHNTHVLTLGPIAPHVTCALLEVALGYMLSWRPESGRFSIACGRGCACYELAGTSSQDRRSVVAPFPTVDTWNPNLHATISSTTSFLLHKRTGDCYVNVTHASNPSPTPRRAPRLANLNRSHVRIDRLGLRVASCLQHCLLAKKGTHTRAIGVQVRAECVDGWRAGKPGHVGAACFANTSSCLHVTI